MKFDCAFEHRDTGERRVIPVQITPDEVEKAGGQELYLHAYALRRAYREASVGFLHVANGVRKIAVH